MIILSLLISLSALSLLFESQFGAFACSVRCRNIGITCFFSPSPPTHPLRNSAVKVEGALSVEVWVLCHQLASAHVDKRAPYAAAGLQLDGRWLQNPTCICSAADVLIPHAETPSNTLALVKQPTMAFQVL